ncbi:kinase-like domain-containing protein [Phaeosphaeria sp. MPI-PUGE-AT-0046c]|nr:kinase-like domain-containing protein [Phaeosphaeria sp. MPI-PUGE-AT-0046c]
MSQQSSSTIRTAIAEATDTTLVIAEGHHYVLRDNECLPYQHERILGNGLSAVVEQVHDVRSKKVYARKTIKISGQRGREEKEVFFHNEVNITRALSGHHHIIKLYATYVSQHEFGLLLQPAADGNNLEDYLSEYLDYSEQLVSPPVDKDVMTRALEQAFGCLANGLNYIHSRGIRHRDIKPQNILMHKHSIIITDFGSSKNTIQLGKNTTEGIVDFQTRRYSAPEVLEEEKRSFDADVYSLGCVFIEILSALSQQAFEYDPKAIYAQVMDDLHRSMELATLLPRLACLRDIIKSMTLHNREGRYDVSMVDQDIRRRTGFRCKKCEHQFMLDQGRRMPKGKGQKVRGTYEPGTNNMYYEKIDTTFYVRHRKFFCEGRVFAVIMNETAGATSGATSITSATNLDATDYNSSKSISPVRYGDNYVYTNVRRFIVVRAKREFCYAIPIFTYSGRATTKRGVRPSEHGIAYSWGQKAQLLPGEGGIIKPSIAVVMAEGVVNLHIASRIYYGIMHPIQYNVKVKDIGYVPEIHVPSLIGNWKAEEENDTYQAAEVTRNAENPEEDQDDDEDDDDDDEDDNDGDEINDHDDTRTGPNSPQHILQDTGSISHVFANMNVHSS